MIARFLTAGGHIWQPGDNFKIISMDESMHGEKKGIPKIAKLKPLGNRSGEIYAAGVIDKSGKQIGIIFPNGAVMEMDGDKNV